MTPHSLAPSTADRACLGAIRAWHPEPSPAFWEGFRPSWRTALRSAWEERFKRITPEDAEARLREDHAAEAAPDLARVHPSWLIRALRDESPSVLLAVIGAAPLPLRSLLRTGLAVPEDAIVPDAPALPEFVGWASAFWAERLVGGPPPRGDDSPAILALATPGRSRLARLLRTCALVKAAEARDDLADWPLRDRERRRLADLRTREPGPGAALARRDLDEIRRANKPGPTALGLFTIGRLLAPAEPFRSRWALQHLPYGLAKAVRARIADAGEAADREEERVLAIAQELLEAEGRSGRPVGGIS